ncbi:hypothetical protein PGB90_005857 [Kerria lacca]
MKSLASLVTVSQLSLRESLRRRRKTSINKRLAALNHRGIQPQRKTFTYHGTKTKALNLQTPLTTERESLGASLPIDISIERRTPRISNENTNEFLITNSINNYQESQQNNILGKEVVQNSIKHSGSKISQNANDNVETTDKQIVQNTFKTNTTTSDKNAKKKIPRTRKLNISNRIVENIVPHTNSPLSEKLVTKNVKNNNLNTSIVIKRTSKNKTSNNLVTGENVEEGFKPYTNDVEINIGKKSKCRKYSRSSPVCYSKIFYNEAEDKWIEYRIFEEEEKFKLSQMLTVSPMENQIKEQSIIPKTKCRRLKGRKTSKLQRMLPTAFIKTDKREDLPYQKIEVTDQLRMELHKRNMPVVPCYFQKHIIEYGKLPFRSNPRSH